MSGMYRANICHMRERSREESGMKCKYPGGCGEDATYFRSIRGTDRMVVRCSHHWVNFQQFLNCESPLELDDMTEAEAEVLEIQRS